MQLHDIVTKAEIESIFERATRLVDRVFEADEEEDDDDDLGMRRDAEHGRALRSAVEAMRFCAHAASCLRDPSLGHVVVEAIERMAHFDDDAYPHRYVMHEALRDLLRVGLTVDERVRALAKSDDAGARQALAAGLNPRGNAEREILDALASDPVAEVRKAAHASLAAVTDVTWWNGKWKSDPTARLLPGEQETCGPSLRRASEILDESQYTLLRSKPALLKELVAHLERLPDDLAVEAIEQFCRPTDRYLIPLLAPVVHLLLDRRGGIEAFERMVEHWGSTEYGSLYDDAAAATLREAAPDARLAVCRRLIARASGAPLAERLALREGPTWLAAGVAKLAWPPSADISLVLDVLLALGAEELPQYETDWVRSTLADILRAKGMDPTPVLDRLVEARLSGYAGAWAGLDRDADVLLDRAPPDVLRAAAERAVQSENDATVLWGAKRLLGILPARDEEGAGAEDAEAAGEEASDDDGAGGSEPGGSEDPPGPAEPAEAARKEPAGLDLLRAMLSEGRVRAALLRDDDVVARALPVLRDELRRGVLPYREAASALDAIGRVYGGTAEARALRHAFLRMTDPEATRLALQRKVEAFLGPQELRGPPTEEEWQALERAREAFVTTDLQEAASLWAHTLRPGAWRPDERAELERLFGLFHDGHADELDLALSSALLAKPYAELLPRMDEVIAACGPHARPLLKSFRADLREALGLSRARTAPDGGAASVADDDDPEWGDDEDDDE